MEESGTKTFEELLADLQQELSSLHILIQKRINDWERLFNFLSDIIHTDFNLGS